MSKLDDKIDEIKVTESENEKKQAKDLARTINITSANLSILKTGKARAIRFSTLNDICKALDCQPGDILEYIDDGLDDNIENDID